MERIKKAHPNQKKKKKNSSAIKPSGNVNGHHRRLKTDPVAVQRVRRIA